MGIIRGPRGAELLYTKRHPYLVLSTSILTGIRHNASPPVVFIRDGSQRSAAVSNERDEMPESESQFYDETPRGKLAVKAACDPVDYENMADYARDDVDKRRRLV